MGEILRFEPRPGGRSRNRTGLEAGLPDGSGGEVVLFLGVRYERQDGVNTIAGKGRSKRGKNRKRA